MNKNPHGSRNTSSSLMVSPCTHGSSGLTFRFETFWLKLKGFDEAVNEG
jgi:hypothetical protein